MRDEEAKRNQGCCGGEIRRGKEWRRERRREREWRRREGDEVR